MSMVFLHERADFKDLINITAREQNIDDPSLVEKDYWKHSWDLIAVSPLTA